MSLEQPMLLCRGIRPRSFTSKRQVEQSAQTKIKCPLPEVGEVERISLDAQDTLDITPLLIRDAISHFKPGELVQDDVLR